MKITVLFTYLITVSYLVSLSYARIRRKKISEKTHLVKAQSKDNHTVQIKEKQKTVQLKHSAHNRKQSNSKVVQKNTFIHLSNWGYDCHVSVPSYKWNKLLTFLIRRKHLTSEYKCLLSCEMKTLAIQKRNGKFNKMFFDIELENIKPFYSNRKHYQRDKKKTFACLHKVVQGKNHCDNAANLMKCVGIAQIKAFAKIKKT